MSKNKDKYKFWPPGLVEFFSYSALCSHILLLYIEDNHFHVLYAVFLPVSKEKLCVSTRAMLYTYSMTPWQRRFLLNWEYKIHLCKSHSRGDDFSSKVYCQQLAKEEFHSCITCHRLLLTWTMTKQTNLCSSAFSFSDLKLSIRSDFNIFLKLCSALRVINKTIELKTAFFYWILKF